MKKITQALFSEIADKYLFAAIIVLELLFTVIVALTWGRSSIDETEHLHMSWLVSAGELPYRDFFEHHNPLLWYVFAPIAALFFNSAYVYYAGHFFSLTVSIFTLIYLYKIVVRYIASPMVAITALMLYTACNWSGRITLIEFRPDVLMNFCFFFGLYYYMRYMEKQKVKNLIIAFTLFTLSFLFLQKIILLLFFLGLYTLFKLYQKQIRWGDIAKALILPLVIMSAFILFLYFNGILETYFTLNYTLNTMLAHHFGLHQLVFRFENARLFIPMINGYNAIDFDLLAVVSTIMSFTVIVLYNHKADKFLRLLFFLFIVELLMRYLTFSPNHHYFTTFKMISCILSAYLLNAVSPKLQKIIFGCFAVFFTITGASDSYDYLLYQNSLKTHVKRLEFVLENSAPDDTILNGNKRNFNIYRKDADYLGFLLNDVGYVYNQNFGDSNYDVNKIILEKKPKIIWMENYTNTSLYEKRFKALRDFNLNLLYLWKKYPNQKYNINDLIINVPEFYSYELDKDMLSRYYEPTGLENFWILKKHIDNPQNDDYDTTDNNNKEN